MTAHRCMVCGTEDPLARVSVRQGPPSSPTPMITCDDCAHYVDTPSRRAIAWQILFDLSRKIRDMGADGYYHRLIEAMDTLNEASDYIYKGTQNDHIDDSPRSDRLRTSTPACVRQSQGPGLPLHKHGRRRVDYLRLCVRAAEGR